MEKNIKDILKEIKAAEVKSDPYLATRVMAHVNSQQTAKPQWFWKVSTIVSLLTCLVVLFFNRPSQITPNFSAEVNKPQVVKVEVAPFNFTETIQAEIILPDNVEFYSNDYMELSQLRTLRLNIDPNSMKSLPFIIKGDVQGNKSIQVKFYDSNDKLVKTKEINILFFKGLGENS